MSDRLNSCRAVRKFSSLGELSHPLVAVGIVLIALFLQACGSAGDSSFSASVTDSPSRVQSFSQQIISFHTSVRDSTWANHSALDTIPVPQRVDVIDIYRAYDLDSVCQFTVSDTRGRLIVILDCDSTGTPTNPSALDALDSAIARAQNGVHIIQTRPGVISHDLFITWHLASNGRWQISEAAMTSFGGVSVIAPRDTGVPVPPPEVNRRHASRSTFRLPKGQDVWYWEYP